MRRILFLCWSSFEDICDRNGRFIGEEDLEPLASFAEGALGCHSELAEEAAQLNSQRWKWLPKCHMATHLAYDNARQANPRTVHCYADEDMVGRVQRMLKLMASLSARLHRFDI